MIKLIGFDLDGTLLNDDGEISEYTKHQLNQLVEKEIILVPCSARPLSRMPEWLKENKKIPYLVCHNGAEIYDNVTKELVASHTLSGTQALYVSEKLCSMNDWFSYNIGEQLYSTLSLYEYLKPQDTAFKRSMYHYPGRFYIPDYKIFLKEVTGINRLHISVDTDEEREALYLLANKLTDVYVTSSHPNNIEITHLNATKGYALKTIMERFNILAEEAIAFGDNDNDISMMEVVENSVAMKDGTPRLKQKAKYITTEDHNHDGVVKMIDIMLQGK